MNEIVFNGKSNYKDFGAYLNFFNPQPPEPKVIKQSVPFMNGSYDFSTVATNGEIVFKDRKIDCSIEFVGKSKGELMNLYTELLEWLLVEKCDLIYTGEPDMKYLARVEEVPSFDLFYSLGGTLKFSFIAEPFKQSIDYISDNMPWDTFNFLNGYLAPTSFNVTENQNIVVYNPGRTISPKINVSSNMTIIRDGIVIDLFSGNNINKDFKLLQGANTINIAVGSGTISFIFRKVSL